MNATDIEPAPPRWHLMTAWLATATEPTEPGPRWRGGPRWHRRDDRPPATAAENTVALLVLIATITGSGGHVTTAASAKSRNGIAGLGAAGDYPRIPHAEVLALLAAAAAEGLLERRQYRNAKGVRHERYRVTQAGRQYIDAATRGNADA